MRDRLLTGLGAAAFALCSLWLVWSAGGHEAWAADRRPALHMPWKEAGLDQRQAAAHLLNRLAYGPRPGQVEAVVARGLDRWVEEQIAGSLPDPNLQARLRDMPALFLSEADMVRIYPNPNMILQQAQKEGVISKDEVAAAKEAKILQQLRGGAKNPNLVADSTGAPAPAAAPAVVRSNGPAPASAAMESRDGEALRAKILEFARRRGYRPQRELMAQLLAQKIVRAAEAQNQLAEVMTDFWFNHFNVSLTNDRTRPYLLSYERDAIRAHALGTMRELLEATARHPAMLQYLDNAQSTAAPNAPTLLGDQLDRMPARPPAGYYPRPGWWFPGRRGGFAPRPPAPQAPKREKPHGLNENYARELLELHTLGVDGGYAQQDVIEVARAFTGWTVLPAGPAREQVEKRLDRVRQFGGLGFRTDGDFLFRADMHDSAAKTILGQRLPAGRGMEDGEAVLDLLARHSSTARHLAGKLAVRFVSDKPPRALVDRLAGVYLQSGGDTRQVLRAIVQAPEFWSRDAVGAKIKSPFELAVSAVRVSGAHIEDPRSLLDWVSRMGQPLYAYQAPTGYPDRAEAWVNTGSLLNRMNFGLQFAAEKVRGVAIDLPSLCDGREPESREAALRTYASLLLPGRDLGATIKMLTPMVSAPNLAHHVDQAAVPQDGAPAAGKVAGKPAAEKAIGVEPARYSAPAVPAGPAGAGGAGDGGSMAGGMASMAGLAGTDAADHEASRPVGGMAELTAAPKPGMPTPLEQVVGVILGSPEFQRR
jgi:uncharacterized protein (DUF1800 family)